jgi:uncharacterized membrane protein YgcG
MKVLGFSLSLLVHLLLFLLIVTVRFPVIKLELKPQIIQIVPLSPPPTDSQPLRVPAKLYLIMPLSSPPTVGQSLRAPVKRYPIAPLSPPPKVGQSLRAPVKVYTRPFFLKGGTQGDARSQLSDKIVGAESGSPQSPVLNRGSAAATARPAQPEQWKPSSLAFVSGVPEATGKRSGLSVNLDRIPQLFREQETAGGRSGNSRSAAESGSDGLPFGDHSAGGGGGDGTPSYALGGNAYFDSRGYDITPWAKRMVYRVKKNWIPPAISEYGLKGAVGIYLLIRRDGTISKMYVRKTSGIKPLDQAAFNAIELSTPLMPLPDDFPNADLPAYLLFYYN